MPRRLRPLLGLGVVTLLAACSGGSWFGSDEEAQLPGKRVPVMLLDRGLSADPRLASLEVRLPPPERNLEWPQSGGVPSHAMQHLAVADQLSLAWQTDVGEGTGDETQILAEPVVGGGRIYTMDADGVIRALDTRSGSTVWSVEPEGLDPEGAVFGGGLAYDSGQLYATISSGEVLDLDAARGAEVWRQRLGVPLRAAPTVAEGRVLVVTADNQLYALDGETGRPIWRHAGFFEGAGLLGGPSPAVDGELVVVPYSSAEVYALRLDNGNVLWNDTVQRPRRTEALAQINDIDAFPVIAGGDVYVAGYGGEMAAIELRRGVRRWNVDIASTETPWLAGDFLYVLTIRDEVVCLLRADGRVRWVSPLPHLTEPDDPSSTPITWTGPLLAGDRLLLAGSNGEAITMSPYNGEILGRLELPGRVVVPPIAADGTVYILTEDAELLAYR